MSLTTRSQGNVQILELDGRFDAHIAPEVDAWQDRATSPYVVVNLSGVSFIDSSALASLVRGMKRFRQQGGDLRICGLQQPVRIIFELTRMNKAFQLCNTEEEAIQTFTN